MFPVIKADLQKLEQAAESSQGILQCGNAFAFDYTTGQHMLIDGKVEKCTDTTAIAQWIEKVIRTEKNKYEIYTEDEAEEFGISIYQYIGLKNFPLGFAASELKRELTEQLTAHPMIEEIQDFRTEKEKRGLKVFFSVVLKDGQILRKEAFYGI